MSDKYQNAAAAWSGVVPSGFDKYQNAGDDKWKWTNRTSFDQQSFLIRPVSHPSLLPAGFHPFIKHNIQIDLKDPEQITQILCTSSYAPELPCHTCDAMYDLDKYGMLKRLEKENPKLYKAIMAASAPAGGYFILPCFVRGEWGKKLGQARNGQPAKEWDTLFPHSTDTVSSCLVMKMATAACNRLFGMFQELKAVEPTLDNMQFGKWLVYTREQTNQHLKVAPKDLQRPLTKEELELCNEKNYPKLQTWGASEKDPAKDTRHSYAQARSVLCESWMGKELAKEYDYDLEGVEKISHTLRPGYDPNAGNIPF